MPNHVFNIIKISGKRSTVKLLDKAVKTDKEQPFDFNRIVPQPPIVELVSSGPLAEETQRENPNRNWYEWQINHWGTKWNAYDFTKAKPGRYAFCTAWSPPLPIMNSLSQLFPELDIEIEYHEEFDQFGGQMTFRNGQIVSDEKPDRP